MPLNNIATLTLACNDYGYSRLIFITTLIYFNVKVRDTYMRI